MKGTRSRYAYGMRNELHSRLNGLHRLIQYSRFCPRRDQKDLILMEREEQRKTVTSHFTDELKLVVHRVGFSFRLVILPTSSRWHHCRPAFLQTRVTQRCEEH